MKSDGGYANVFAVFMSLCLFKEMLRFYIRKYKMLTVSVIDIYPDFHYNKLNSKSGFAKEKNQMSPILLGTLNLIIYFVIAVILAFSGRVLFTIPDEIFRKILHFILLGSFYVLIVSYPTWLSAASLLCLWER